MHEFDSLAQQVAASPGVREQPEGPEEVTVLLQYPFVGLPGRCIEEDDEKVCVVEVLLEQVQP